jgi:hypothetical protein
MTNDIEETSNAHYYDFDHALEMLNKRKPPEIAMAASVDFDENNSCFTFLSLGQSITVTYPDYKVMFTETGEIPVINWRIPILHYLSTSNGLPLSGNFVPFKYINDFSVHPENFEEHTGGRLLKFFDDKPVDKLRKACEALGGEVLDGRADLDVRFGYMPNFAVHFRLYYSDDDISGSGKFLFDELCKYYIHDMDIHICGPLLASFIIKQYKFMEGIFN